MSTRQCNTSASEAFWKSMDILISKPHVVNKRIWGYNILNRVTCVDLHSMWKSNSLIKHDGDNFIEHIIKDYKLVPFVESSDCPGPIVELIVAELLPKNYNERRAYQLISLHKNDVEVFFYNISPEAHNLFPDFTYSFKLESDAIVLKSEENEASLTKSWVWLKETVLPQLMKWSDDFSKNIDKKVLCNNSLQLVSNEKYYIKYNELKLKHGKEMVKIWPECTDPSKFVYEDIAIATYLLLLWENNKEKVQHFVDLGCGNGLLVYILTKEGHKGVGIDVRKRNIWDLYPEDIVLEEKTIIPSDANLFPDAQWIIGNHSDELTPWIPVIAARSSYYCNFFLLPCCAFHFDGTKYQRQNSSKSQYSEYLEYIKQLSDDCGFYTETDRLKIPSTKRICLVGRGRRFQEMEQNNNSNNITQIIASNTSEENMKEETWVNDYKTRDPIERVRNCTQIDKSTVDYIVQFVANHILKDYDMTSEWHLEDSIDISELVKILPQDKLKSLKSECGGLATLLKNNHHIFMIRNGKVQFRYPKTISEVQNNQSNKAKKIKIQQRPCWFHNHHPKGCPLSKTDCSFLH